MLGHKISRDLIIFGMAAVFDAHGLKRLFTYLFKHLITLASITVVFGNSEYKQGFFVRK